VESYFALYGSVSLCVQPKIWSHPSWKCPSLAERAKVWEAQVPIGLQWAADIFWGRMRMQKVWCRNLHYSLTACAQLWMRCLINVFCVAYQYHIHNISNAALSRKEFDAATLTSTHTLQQLTPTFTHCLTLQTSSDITRVGQKIVLKKSRANALDTYRPCTICLEYFIEQCMWENNLCLIETI